MKSLGPLEIEEIKARKGKITYLCGPVVIKRQRQTRTLIFKILGAHFIQSVKIVIESTEFNSKAHIFKSDPRSLMRGYSTAGCARKPPLRQKLESATL